MLSSASKVAGAGRFAGALQTKVLSSAPEVAGVGRFAGALQTKVLSSTPKVAGAECFAGALQAKVLSSAPGRTPNAPRVGASCEMRKNGAKKRADFSSRPLRIIMI